jgi:hypothetical protein
MKRGPRPKRSCIARHDELRLKSKRKRRSLTSISLTVAEARLNDLDRLCEITFNLIRESNESPGDLQLGAHAALIAEITCGWMKALKRTYYDWYNSPPPDDEGDIVTPSLPGR